MTRSWIAAALLGLSWMWGLEYYTPASGWLWSIAVIAAVALLTETPRRAPDRTDAAIALIVSLPVLWMLPWPGRAVPLALVLGLLPFVVGGAPPLAVGLGWAAVRGAMVLGVQAVVLQAYSFLTARSHDLPWPAAPLAALVARLLGADASADADAVVLFSTSGPQRLAVTWQLVLDPVTVLLVAGSLVLVALRAWEEQPAEQADRSWGPARRWLRTVGLVLLAVGLWLPIRLGLLLGLFLHREMRAPEELKLAVMNQFFSPWVLGLASLGAVASLAWFVRPGPTIQPPQSGRAEPSVPVSRRLLAAICLTLAVGTATMLLVVDPVGKPRGGRVTFVERHSDWEPSDRPYDTRSFGHDPSYGYSAIYDYCGQYFEMSRLADDQKIDAARLAACDVLVIKTPTEAYSTDEIEAVLRFVARGGGLLLIGEHTDFMHTGTHLNAIAEPLGFKFRPDNLFGIDKPYDQYVRPERLPHPALRNVPVVRYANSCSIDPGGSWGRAAVRSTGLWSLGADYNMENYFPEAYLRPEMRYGAFIQLWETRHGKGRVLAFTDSTIFSNFSAFEPGKAEFLREMLSWLNCRSPFDSAPLRWMVRACGVVLLAASAWLAAVRYPRSASAWLVGFGCVLLGYVGSTETVAAGRRGGSPDCVRPLVRVVLDRTVSRVPLSEGGFTREPAGYGLLEQWIPRLGYYTVRAEGPEAFSGDVLLVLSPTESVSEDYRNRLAAWVSQGGKLLVFDATDNHRTTANSLLWPFGISVYHANPAQGNLRDNDGKWPGIPVESACQIEGGEPFLWVGQTAVAATARHGRGTVAAIGFGSLMNNTGMGGMWTAEPDAAQLAIYRLLFELVQATVESRPLREPSPLAKLPAGSTAGSGSKAVKTIPREGPSPEVAPTQGLPSQAR